MKCFKLRNDVAIIAFQKDEGFWYKSREGTRLEAWKLTRRR